MFATIQEAYRIPAFAKVRRGVPVNSPSQAVENFKADNAGGDMNIGPSERVTYKGQANDYNYYKQNYGLKFPEMEGFTADGQCMSDKSIYYELPISEESKAAHKKALDQSFGQTSAGPSTKAFVPDQRTVDMNEVSGYVDEDLEKYLSTREARAEFPAADNTALAKALRHFGVGATAASGAALPPKSIAHPVTNTGVDNRAWELIILAFFGILIILLCEQLFKLAMMISMKQTVNILKPYLSS